MSKQYSIWTDGGARGNPGLAAVGIVIKEESSTLAEIAEPIGIATNNQAEYIALKRGLEYIVKNLIGSSKRAKQLSLNIFTDSELLAFQIRGSYKVKNTELKSIYKTVVELLNQFKSYTITPVNREQNQLADRLVNQALDEVSHV